MAEQKFEPKFHGYEDMLEDNKAKKSKTLDYEQLLEREKMKRADLERTKAWLAEDSSLQEYTEVPQMELALFEHYSDMNQVGMDPEIKEFWEAQKEALGSIDMKTPQNEYLEAYRSWQNELERMDDKTRDELGVDYDYDQKEKQAKLAIRQAKSRYREAWAKARSLENDVNPFQAMIESITGTGKRPVINALKGLRDAKKGIKDAKRQLLSVQESRARFEQNKDKINVRQALLLDTMLTAQEKMEANKKTAQQIHANSLKIQKVLHKQYELIDKYNAIQKFKQSKIYQDAKNRKDGDPVNPILDELVKKLDTVPESMPRKSIIVTLRGPVQLLPLNTEKIEELNRKIEEAKGKVSYDVDIEHLDTELEQATLQPTDTLKDLNLALNNMSEDEKEYKQLELKRDHLKLQNDVNTATATVTNLINEVKTLQTEIVALSEKSDLSPADQVVLQNKQNTLQAKLLTLKSQKENLERLETSLQNDSYSQNIARLQELQSLVQERENIHEENHPELIESIAQQLEHSRLPLESGDNILSVSILYTSILKTIQERKERALAGIIRSSDTTRPEIEGESR